MRNAFRPTSVHLRALCSKHCFSFISEQFLSIKFPVSVKVSNSFWPLGEKFLFIFFHSTLYNTERFAFLNEHLRLSPSNFPNIAKFNQKLRYEERKKRVRKRHVGVSIRSLKHDIKLFLLFDNSERQLTHLGKRKLRRKVNRFEEWIHNAVANVIGTEAIQKLSNICTSFQDLSAVVPIMTVAWNAHSHVNRYAMKNIEHVGRDIQHTRAVFRSENLVR